MIPLVPFIVTLSVALPIVTTPPVTSKTSALLANIDIELFSITTLSCPVVPPVLCKVNVPPVSTVSPPKFATCASAANTAIPASVISTLSSLSAAPKKLAVNPAAEDEKELPVTLPLMISIVPPPTST